MRLLLMFPLGLIFGCAAPPVAVPNQELTGLHLDRYVMPAAEDLPDPQTPEERAQLESQWPAVDAISLPNHSDIRRVAYRPTSTAAPARTPDSLPHCGSVRAANRACLGVSGGAVFLRAESNGYGAPRLTLTPAR
jgi:hypothetical protein